ncbi:MAG: hypothetical protein JKY31_06000 [Rhodobacteraceae bacterium]|nr:hypothetical protein [Paracoccaceae bacterium]
MNHTKLVQILLILWVVFFVWSFIYAQIAEPAGDSFTRGLNRLSTFGYWHAIALVFAAASWSMGAKLEKGSKLQKRSVIPMIVECVFGVIALVVIIYFSVMKEPVVIADPLARIPTEVTAPAD